MYWNSGLKAPLFGLLQKSFKFPSSVKQIEVSKPGPSGRRKRKLWFPAAESENGVNCQFYAVFTINKCDCKLCSKTWSMFPAHDGLRDELTDHFQIELGGYAWLGATHRSCNFLERQAGKASESNRE
jgi:hypothetical protein